MNRIGWCASFAALIAASASGSDLNLKIEKLGASTVTVGPGGQVPYALIGELSDASSDGLAMFCVDLAFTGGPLAQAQTPTTVPMKNFASPLGLSNPQGYGGVVSGGALKQLGGAQNTINNTLAPQPIGAVITGVAQPGQPVTLANGVLTAPYAVGSFTLTPSNLFANVIRQGQTGSPFWRVDPAGTGSVQSLLVTVEAIRASVHVVSVGSSGSQILTLNAGPANAGRTYMVLGSTTGTSPGISLGGGLVLPLNGGTYFRFTRSNPNSAILQNSLGTLDSNGKGAATFHPDASFQGQTVHHAFVVLSPVDFVSEAEHVQVVP